MSDPTQNQPTPAVAAGHPRLAHIALTVSDLDRAIAFYQAAVGAEVSERGSDGCHCWAFLEIDGVEALTLWQLGDGAAASAGLHHLAFQVRDEAALHATRRTLEALDTPFVYGGVVPHAEGSSSAGIFFLDGDGLRVEVYADEAVTDEPAPNGSVPTCGFF